MLAACRLGCALLTRARGHVRCATLTLDGGQRCRRTCSTSNAAGCRRARLLQESASPNLMQRRVVAAVECPRLREMHRPETLATTEQTHGAASGSASTTQHSEEPRFQRRSWASQTRINDSDRGLFRGRKKQDSLERKDRQVHD
jgi:hypothetical protein